MERQIQKVLERLNWSGEPGAGAAQGLAFNNCSTDLMTSSLRVRVLGGFVKTHPCMIAKHDAVVAVHDGIADLRRKPHHGEIHADRAHIPARPWNCGV